MKTIETESNKAMTNALSLLSILTGETTASLKVKYGLSTDTDTDDTANNGAAPSNTSSDGSDTDGSNTDGSDSGTSGVEGSTADLVSKTGEY
jgi:hypothetical protein